MNSDLKTYIMLLFFIIIIICCYICPVIFRKNKKDNESEQDKEKKSIKNAYISLVFLIVSTILILFLIVYIINENESTRSVLLICAIPIYITGFLISINAYITYKTTPAFTMFLLYIIITSVLILSIIGYFVMMDVTNSCIGQCNDCYSPIKNCD